MKHTEYTKRVGEHVLHRAPWIVPVSSPIIEDGAVLVEDGRILEVGRFADLKSETCKICEHDGIITPGLINAHTHLELSHLSAACPRPEDRNIDGDIAAWILNLLNLREGGSFEEKRAECAHDALLKMIAGGVGVVADIGNNLESVDFGSTAPCTKFFFLELMGISSSAETKTLKLLTEIPDAICCTGHGPYSTGVELLKKLKDRCRKQQSLFPIHAAESEDEMQFLHDGTGRLRTFLEERGAIDDAFRPPGTGAVAYLDKLGLLDADTLLVHGVHVTDEEIDCIVKHKSKVCLCPGSNRTLGVGTAPVMKYLDRGILPALGTDSLASNATLDIRREMQVLMEEVPGLHPEKVFAMATLGGAQALGCMASFGSLASGKSNVLLVRNNGIKRNEIYEFLVTNGSMAEVEWLT